MLRHMQDFKRVSDHFMTLRSKGLKEENSFIGSNPSHLERQLCAIISFAIYKCTFQVEAF